MGSNIMHKTFCRICGVQMTNVPNKLSDEDAAALPPQVKSFYEAQFQMACVNIRTLNNFDISSVKVGKVDGFNMIPPPYVDP